MHMDSSNFQVIADDALLELAETVESKLDSADLEYIQGVLTIELDDGRQFVVNRHEPTKQIWLSSPISGAHRFAFDEADDKWKKTGTSAILADFLLNELNIS